MPRFDRRSQERNYRIPSVREIRIDRDLKKKQSPSEESCPGNDSTEKFIRKKRETARKGDKNLSGTAEITNLSLTLGGGVTYNIRHHYRAAVSSPPYHFFTII
jgi:5-methylcytosine-specific restriction endonuclease McrA